MQWIRIRDKKERTMKYNRLLSASLLASLACVLSIGECGGCCDDCMVDTCLDGELKDCVDSTTALTCIHNDWIKVNCAASGMVCDSTKKQCCDATTGECMAPIAQLCNGEQQTGGKVGDACDPDCYKETCLNSGANALVCEGKVIKQKTCEVACQEASSASDPLHAYCPQPEEQEQESN